MQIKVKTDAAVKEIEILITAEKKSQAVDDLVHFIRGYEKRIMTITAYKGDKAYLVDVTSIMRIYTGNQKVYIQTSQDEYVVRYRLYELEELLDESVFLRISNSEIVNTRKICNIDLSITSKICIHFSDNIQTYVSRRYIPKIKKKLGI